MNKLFLFLIALLTITPSTFAQHAELDSLKKDIKELEVRIKKLEKAQGPGFNKNYFDDVENAFLATGYYQGTYNISDSTNAVTNYGFNIHYAEKKISAVINAAWGGDKFFSSFYIGYNFYGKNNRIVLTPLLGGISWGDNIWDNKQSVWSYGLAITGMQKVPFSLSLLKHERGMGFSISYMFNLK